MVLNIWNTGYCSCSHPLDHVLYIMHRVYIFLFFIYFFLYDFANYDFVNLFKFSSNEYRCTLKSELPKLNLTDIMALFTISILIIYSLFIILQYHSYTFRYVRFTNNISTLNKQGRKGTSESCGVFIWERARYR